MATLESGRVRTVSTELQVGRVGLVQQHLSPSVHAVSHGAVHAGVLH
jgi:hypothetical protein